MPPRWPLLLRFHAQAKAGARRRSGGTVSHCCPGSFSFSFFFLSLSPALPWHAHAHGHPARASRAVPHHDAVGRTTGLCCPVRVHLLPRPWIRHRKPGALQKFLAFFLFLLGLREAFHAYFKTSQVAGIDGYIPSSGQAAKTNLYAGKDSSRLRGGTLTVVAFLCTLLSTSSSSCYVHVRSTADASSGRYQLDYAVPGGKRRLTKFRVLDDGHRPGLCFACLVTS